MGQHTSKKGGAYDPLIKKGQKNKQQGWGGGAYKRKKL